jgi:ubiquinone biosynthesis protein
MGRLTSRPGSDGSLLGSARRDLGRLQEVAAIIARHGFGDLLMRTPLGPRLLRGGQVPEREAEVARAPACVRFVRLLAALGPTYIKLGQILSMRRDLLPSDWIEELETLQDNAPEISFDAVRTVVEEGLGVPLAQVFAKFDEKPLAMASIAQIHRATTHGGEHVVVKVQRPGIDDKLRGDLDLLFLAAQVLEASIDEMQLLGISQVVEEFEKGLLEELDFGVEIANMLEARAFLDPVRSVTVPRPYPDLSCATVLTMQFFAGRPLRGLEPHSETARHAVEEIVHAACKQVLVDGFFHGDPHAGNILIDEEGTLCMLDMGLAGRLSEAQRDEFVTLAIATLAGDSATIARIMLRMGTPTQRVDLAALRAEIERIRGKYLAVESLAELDSAAFAEEFAEAAQHFRIKLAPEYSILTKAATTIEGIVRHLHPEVDLGAIVRPYVRQMLAARYSPTALVSDFLGEANAVASMVRDLPPKLDQILHDVETGNVQVRAVTPALDDVPDVLHQLAGRLGLAAFAVSMTLAAAVLLAAEAMVVWRAILGIACALAAAGAWTVLFWWHVVGRGKPLRLRPLIRMFRR